MNSSPIRFKQWMITEARKDDHFFNYTELAKDNWREVLKDATEQFKVDFNTENDDKVTQRIIKIDQNHWDHTNCKFACELRMAGGDWECSVAYFRCQLIDGYAKGLSKYGQSMFCFIPIKGEGNDHLIRTKSGWSAPDSDCKERANEWKCWQSLKKYITDLVNKEIESSKSHSQLSV